MFTVSVSWNLAKLHTAQFSICSTPTRVSWFMIQDPTWLGRERGSALHRSRSTLFVRLLLFFTVIFCSPHRVNSMKILLIGSLTCLWRSNDYIVRGLDKQNSCDVSSWISENMVYLWVAAHIGHKNCYLGVTLVEPSWLWYFPEVQIRKKDWYRSGEHQSSKEGT